MCFTINISIYSRILFSFCFGLLLISSPGLKGQTETINNSSKFFRLKTTDGVEFGVWGSELNSSAPKPLLFILASTIEETLGDAYYRQCGSRLGKEEGWLCVSIDLPLHGAYKKKESPSEIAGWADAARNGIDLVTENNNRMYKVLQYLIENGYADKERIALCGTSRGGYLALQFAAMEPRVNSVAAFCPVTDLSVLTEFKGIPKSTIDTYFSLNDKIDKLSQKWIWIVIGDQDSRVDTDEVIRFSRKVSESDRKLKGRQKGGIELNVMYEPRGHTTPAGSVDRAVDWVLSKSVKSN